MDADWRRVFTGLGFRAHLKREEGPATALFGDGIALARRHVIPTLMSMAELTDEIIESFAAQFGGRNSHA